jgi:hypothetical protein
MRVAVAPWLIPFSWVGLHVDINGTISRVDVADFLVQQIEDRSYLRKTPVLVY